MRQPAVEALEPRAGSKGIGDIVPAEERRAYDMHRVVDALIDDVIPEDIRLRRPLNLPPGQGERDVLRTMRGMAAPGTTRCGSATMAAMYAADRSDRISALKRNMILRKLLKTRKEKERDEAEGKPAKDKAKDTEHAL